jgi:hypothetical protein
VAAGGVRIRHGRRADPDRGARRGRCGGAAASGKCPERRALRALARTLLFTTAMETQTPRRTTMNLSTSMKLVLAAAAAAVAACGDDAADADTTARGQAVYRDAETNAAGEPQPAARCAPQPSHDPMLVEILVRGSGDLGDLDPQCSLDGATGSFKGLFSGVATIDGDGAYVATLASADAFFETPSGCEIPTIEIGAVTEVVIRGTLSATTQNCEAYCSAKARSYAEGECSGAGDQVACRAAAEGEYQASCGASCSAETTHVIAAEAALSASALAELNAAALTGAALGELSANLTFDYLADASGNVVSEAP